MHVQALGHVVLKVSDLHRSEDFYSRVLGMRIILRITDPHMTFFTLGTPGTHHDFALMELGPAAPKPESDATGLAHVAFKVGDSAETLRHVRKVLHASGTPVLYRGGADLHEKRARPRSGRERDRAVRRHLNVAPFRLTGTGSICDGTCKNQTGPEGASRPVLPLLVWRLESRARVRACREPRTNHPKTTTPPTRLLGKSTAEVT